MYHCVPFNQNIGDKSLTVVTFRTANRGLTLTFATRDLVAKVDVGHRAKTHAIIWSTERGPWLMGSMHESGRQFDDNR